MQAVLAFAPLDRVGYAAPVTGFKLVNILSRRLLEVHMSPPTTLPGVREQSDSESLTHVVTCQVMVLGPRTISTSNAHRVAAICRF